jgi:hypothetical protein
VAKAGPTAARIIASVRIAWAIGTTKAPVGSETGRHRRRFDIAQGKPPLTGGFYAAEGAENRFPLLDIRKTLC